MKYVPAILIAVALVSAQANAATVQFQELFFENFDSYTVGQPLPTGPIWSEITQNGGSTFVDIRRDDGTVADLVADAFGLGTNNQFLRIVDAGTDGAAARANDIPGFNSKVARVSFDFVEPDVPTVNNINVFLFTGMGVGADVQFNNGVAPVSYTLGEVHHVDLYFNETTDAFDYLGPSGMMTSLGPDRIDVWLDGALAGNDRPSDQPDVTNQDLRSLAFTSGLAGNQTMYIDNVSLAIPEPSAIALLLFGAGLILRRRVLRPAS